MEQCFYSPINRGNFTFHFLIQKVEQATKKPKAEEGSIRREGKSLTHYFFAIVCQNPKSDMPAPLLYPDSRPEPAARRAAAQSIERKRDAHLRLGLRSL